MALKTTSADERMLFISSSDCELAGIGAKKINHKHKVLIVAIFLIIIPITDLRTTCIPAK